MKSNHNVLLIFDCDGVLVDSEPLANRLMMQCLHQEGFDMDMGYAEKNFHGISNKDCIAQVESDFGRKVSPDFFKKLSALTLQEIKHSLQPIPNIRESLELINYTKCVASGSEPDKLTLSLTVTQLKKHFAQLFSASQVQRGKPFPDVFLYAAKEMNYNPRQCIVIEDSDAGVQAARAAGMKVFLYRPLQTPYAYTNKEITVFEDMKQLPSLIDKFIEDNPYLSS